MSTLRLVAALLAYTATGAAAPPAWSLLQSPNFEIYSQASDLSARSALLWFEQLRAFFVQAAVEFDADRPVRIIQFRSVREYDAYRLRPTADAYYIGAESRDYIVMPAPGEFPMAAHEYAHLVLHAGGVHLPAWLCEGLAEFFSTLRIAGHGYQIGGNIPSHTQTLRRETWLALSKLLILNSESVRSREEADLFYSESWALTEMLLTSRQYRPRLPQLIASLNAGLLSSAALSRVYGQSLDSIAADLRSWVDRGIDTSLSVPGVPVAGIQSSSSPLSSFVSRSGLAELLAAAGELDRAATLYRELARESPRNPDISAAQGTIAFRQGDLLGARLKWKEALAEGVTDAHLCYRYANLADDAGVPATEIRSALVRALELKPDFDDARFKLALLEANASNYESALGQLKAMRGIAPSRAFAYWMAVASAQDELGRHNESRRSAQKALASAVTPEQCAQANELAYVAETDVTVQFTHDANGHPQMITTRVPRGTQNWNPFIEPQDRLRRTEGQLKTVECNQGTMTGITVATAAGLLQLAIPDPLHVLVRGVTEFTCGAQPPSAISVEYAASDNNHAGYGVLRGMEVRQDKPVR